MKAHNKDSQSQMTPRKALEFLQEGNNRFIKLPKACHIDDGKVYINQMTNHPNTIEIKTKRKTLKQFLETVPALGDDFVITRDNNPPREVDCSGW